MISDGFKNSKRVSQWAKNEPAVRNSWEMLQVGKAKKQTGNSSTNKSLNESMFNAMSSNTSEIYTKEGREEVEAQLKSKFNI